MGSNAQFVLIGETSDMSQEHVFRSIAGVAGIGSWYGANYNGGRACTLPSGKILLIFSKSTGSGCMMSVVDSTDNILYEDNTALATAYEWSVPANTTALIPFVSPADGEVYMLRQQAYKSGICQCVIDLYKNTDKGLSQTWEFQRQIYTSNVSLGDGFNVSAQGTIFIDGNNIFYNFHSPKSYFGYASGQWMCLYSKDGGVTWNSSIVYNDNGNYGTNSMDFGMIATTWKDGNTYCMASHTMSGTGLWLVCYSTDLVTWSYLRTDGGTLQAQGWSPDYAMMFSTIATSEYLYLYDYWGNTHRKKLGETTYYTGAQFFDKVLNGWEAIPALAFPIDDWWICPYVGSKGELIILETTIFSGGSFFRSNGYGATARKIWRRVN